MYDIIVAGAGVAGCRTAELIAEQGAKTLLLEEHSRIGKPIQCAGLISHRLKSILPDLPENLILNTVKRAKFFSPSDKSENPSLELISRDDVYVVDREKLDRFLFNRAKEAGSEVRLSTKLVGFTRRTRSVEVNTNKDDLETKIIVGADGPNSIVAKRARLKRPNNYLTGVQATVEGNFDDDAVELWFGSDIAPGFFGWLIPENSEKARIGLATNINALKYFDEFSKRRVGKSVKPDVGGRINFGVMSSTVDDRVLLVGDAACQVKPFSGGGVIYSLIGAKYAAQSCIKSLQLGEFDKGFLKRNYDKRWKQHLKYSIHQGMLYRRFFIGSDVRSRLLLNLANPFKFILEKWDMDLL